MAYTSLIAVLALASVALCRPQLPGGQQLGQLPQLGQLSGGQDLFNGAKQLPGLANVQEAGKQAVGAVDTLKGFGQAGADFAVGSIQDHLMNQANGPQNLDPKNIAQQLQGGAADLQSGVQMGQAVGQGFAQDPSGFLGIDANKIANPQQH